MIPEGNLSEFSLSDLLQIVSMEAATGTLALTAPNRNGAIAATRGTILAATCGPKKGDDAVYALFLWESGAFRWQADRTDVEGAVTLPLGDLTREGIRRRDLWLEARTVLPSLDALFSRKAGAQPSAQWPEIERQAWDALERGLTIGDLGRKLGVSPAMAAHALLAPWQAGALEAEFLPAEQVWRGFQVLLSDIVRRYGEISGLKMTAGLADFLIDRALKHGLELAIQDGQVSLTERSPDDPTADCRAFLSEVNDHVARIHGAEFISRIYADHLRSASPAERSALERLGVAEQAAAQAAGD